MKVSKLTEKVYLLRVEHPCADRGIYQIYTIQDEQARWLDTYTSPRKAAECISLRSKQNHPKRHFHTPSGENSPVENGVISILQSPAGLFSPEETFSHSRSLFFKTNTNS